MVNRGIVVVATAVAATLLFGTPAALGQEPLSEGALEIRAASPWVEDGGTFAVNLGVSSASLDSVLKVTIRQPFTGSEQEVRNEIVGSFESGADTDPLREAITIPLSEVLAPGTDEVSVEIGVRSSRSNDDRVLIPQPGVHPVEIALAEADGTEVDSTLVYLNHLPPADEAEPRLSVAMIAEAHSPPLFDSEGVATDVGPARAEASLLARIAQIAGYRDFGVGIDPQILVALASSESSSDSELLDVLTSLVGGSEILASAWVPPDTEAWSETGRSRTLQTSLDEGRAAVAAHLDMDTQDGIWPLDPTLGPIGLTELANLDVESFIAESGRVDTSVLPPDRSGHVGTLEVEAGNGSLSALIPDPVIDEQFRDAEGEAGLRAHRAATLLAAGALTSGRRGNGAAFTVASAADTDVLSAFMAALDPNLAPLVSLVTPSEAFEQSRPIVDEDDEEAISTLKRRRNTPDLAEQEQALAELRSRSAAQASMIPFGDPQSTEIANMLNSVQHRALDAAEMNERLAVADETISSFVDAVTMPQSAVVNVTSRDTTIPLRFENSSDRTLQARLVLSGPQLEFPEGSERLLDLQPGTNRIEIPTTVRSSGEFVIDVALRSPDGTLTLVEQRQRVRSTAFSGVGLVLSGGALMFLVVWWYRTLHVRDREAAEAAEEETHAAPVDGSER